MQQALDVVNQGTSRGPSVSARCGKLLGALSEIRRSITTRDKVPIRRANWSVLPHAHAGLQGCFGEHRPPNLE